MRLIKTVFFACFVLSLAACSGSDLSIDVPGGDARTVKLEFRPGRAVEHQLPLSISGGIPPYDSSIQGCPEWVTLFPQQGILAGTAPSTELGTTFFCSYRVTDSTVPTPQSTSLILRLAVGSPTTLTPFVPLVLPSTPDQEFFVGIYGSVTLPAALGGVGPYEYSFTCAGGRLPSEMGFVPETRVIAGTPDEAFRDSCAYTVTDSSQPAATVSQPIQVTVVGSMTPLVLPSTPDQDFIVDTYGSVTLPAASGGVGPYEYSFTCAGGTLPSGMGFAPETRVIAGTPDESFRDSCVYSVTDSSRPAATVTQPIQVTVVGSLTPLVLPTTPDQEFIVGTYGSITLPAASGGVGPYEYSFTCAGGTLPSGMGFAPETRVIAGTPDESFRDSCVYSVTDSSRPAATVTQPIQVTIVGSMTPLVLPSTPDQVFFVGTYGSITLPAASGGVGPYRYSFTCAGREAAVRDGLRTRNPRDRRHSGQEFPRFVRVFGNGQLAAHRDGLAAHPGYRYRFHDALCPAFRSRSGILRRHLRFRHTPGCFGRRRAVQVLLQLRGRESAIRDGLRTRNPRDCRHSG